MQPWAYYNEWDDYAAHRLRQNIAQGLIMPGYVDNRSIKDVTPDDLQGFTQVHFFAGLGLWSYSARRAGWPDARPLWTGSCPCQPFSAAGKQGGADDPRHLWPDMFRLIRACRPSDVMGEQVAGSLGYGWFDGVRSDLAGENYAGRAVDFPACSIDAPHIRNRLYWIAKRVAQPNGGERNGRAVESQRGEEGRTALGRPDARCGGIGQADAQGGSSGTGLCEVRPEQDRPIPSDDHGRSAVAHSHELVGCRQQPAGQQPQFQSDTRDHGEGGLVHSSGIGRGEGIACPEIQRWWTTVAGADVRLGVTLGDAERTRLEGHAGHGNGSSGWPVEAGPTAPPDGRNGSFWADAEWIMCHDGKARRTQPGLRLLVNGYPNRISDWRTTGNAISPEVAIQVIAAYLETEAAEAA